MMRRLLARLLLAVLGAGLLAAWVPGGLIWHYGECAILVLMLAWLTGWATGGLNARWSWLAFPFLGVVALGGAQLWQSWTVYRLVTFEDTLRWGVYGVVFFLGFQLFAGERSELAFQRIFLAYELLLAVVSTLQWFAGNGKIFWLFDTPEAAGMGPFLNRDHYATFVFLALPVGLVGILREPRKRWWYTIASAALYASVIACGSRAGFVLATAELLSMAFLVKISRRQAIGMAVSILIFGTVVGWGFLFSRFTDHDPFAGRRELAASTLRMVAANPAHGFGLGTWTTVYPSFAEKDFGVFINAAHNDWLQSAADGGLPMLACMLALFGGSMAILRRAPWAAGVPVAFLHGLVDFPMQGRFLPAVVFLTLGVAARAAVDRRQLS